MIEARKIVMTDAERREQAASFAFGNLALTKEWRYKPESELVKLRHMCMEMAGLPRPRERPQICGAQSSDNWEDEDDLPVTCSLAPHTEGKHMGGTRCGTIEWE